MHFAAAPASQHRLDLWAQYSVNVQGSLTLMEAALNRGITQFVLSSSCAVYGSPGQGPLPGDAPQSPMSPEGQSKFMAERMLEQIGRLSGQRSMILRYGCAAGADPRGHIGVSHDPETHLIPLLLDAASREREAAGSGLCDLSGADFVHDVIHVSDVADAHVAALKALEGGAPSAAYNLGLGRGFSLSEVIAAVEEVTGLSVPIIRNPCPEGAQNPICDPAKARQELGFEPRFKELSGIVETAWAWHQRKSNRGSLAA